MCNQYAPETSAALIAKLFNAQWSEDEMNWKDEVYPKYQAPVVRMKEGRRIVDSMSWGFPTQVQGKTKMLTKHVTNARNLASPFWKGSAMNPERRCLVPFRRFAEPRPGKDPVTGRPANWWFTIADQPVAAFAGLWRPTEQGAVFAFATCEPNALVAPLHEKAMPVILLAEDHERWLSGDYADVTALQAPYPSQLMMLADGGLPPTDTTNVAKHAQGNLI